MIVTKNTQTHTTESTHRSKTQRLPHRFQTSGCPTAPQRLPHRSIISGFTPRKHKRSPTARKPSGRPTACENMEKRTNKQGTQRRGKQLLVNQHFPTARRPAVSHRSKSGFPPLEDPALIHRSKTSAQNPGVSPPPRSVCSASPWPLQRTHRPASRWRAAERQSDNDSCAEWALPGAPPARTRRGWPLSRTQHARHLARQNTRKNPDSWGTQKRPHPSC